MVGRFLLLLSLVPVVAAQLTAAPIEDPGPIEPNIGTATVVTEVALDCVTWLSLVGPMQDVVVAATVEAADGVIVTGPATFALPPDPCLSGQSATSIDAVFDVQVTLDALGQTPLPVALHFELQGSSPVPSEDATADVTFDVTAAFVGLISANAPVTIKEGRAVTFDIEVVNHGNTDILVEPTLDAGVWDAAADAVDVARGGAGALVVHVEGGSGEQLVVVTLRPVGPSGDAGDAATVNLLVRGGGFLGTPVPFLAPLALWWAARRYRAE